MILTLKYFLIFCRLGLENPFPYKSQLKFVRDLISEGGDGPHDEKVVHLLGNDVSALHSVPTAIYCFLRAQRPVKNIETENPFRRTIQYAVSEKLHVVTNYFREFVCQLIFVNKSFLPFPLLNTLSNTVAKL